MSIDYDPFSASVLADPMAAYNELREHCPVHRYEHFTPPFATITRYDDVVDVLKDVTVWSSRYGQGPQFTRAKCLNQDPPEHTEFRKLFQKGFTPRMIGRLEPTVLHGVELPAKTKLMVTYAGANRDPSVFSDPDTFRLDRTPEELRRHLSFGLGHHFCPGSSLSRLEARVTLRLFAARLPKLRLTGAPVRIEPFNLWGQKRLPVAWS